MFTYGMKLLCIGSCSSANLALGIDESDGPPTPLLTACNEVECPACTAH